MSISNEWSQKYFIPIEKKAVSLEYGLLPTHYIPMFYIMQNQITINNRYQTFCHAYE